MNTAGIARLLGGHRQGHDWRAQCPLCGYGLSLAEGEDGKLLAHCFGGCSFEELRVALVEYGLLDPDDFDVEPSVPIRQAVRPSDEELQYRVEGAHWLYRRAASEPRIASYLAVRGLYWVPPILRFLEHAPHRNGNRFPAMLAPITAPSGELVGTHMTYLRPDGRGKADLPKDQQRETRGLARGGAIRLMSHHPDQPIGLAEGIETAMSAALIFKIPFWSVIYAGNFRTVALPTTVRRVVIAMDYDINRTSATNVLTALDKWKGEGREVQLKRPHEPGTDFNDVLLARGGK